MNRSFLMKRLLFVWLIFLFSFIGCAQKKLEVVTNVDLGKDQKIDKKDIKTQGVLFDANVADLNGTWTQIFVKLTDPEIDELVKKINSDSEKQMKFSWGNGVFNVNGSWYFDITDTANKFYPDGGPLYIVVSTTKNELGNIVIEIISRETFEKFVSEKTSINRYTKKIILHFVNENRIIITNTEVLFYTRPIELYRLSGPNMKNDPSGN